MESWGFLWADERAPSQINNAAGLNIQVINSDDVKHLNIKLYFVRYINHNITNLTRFEFVYKKTRM